MKTKINRMGLLPLMVLCLVLVAGIGITKAANFTVAPLVNNTDNLIGATNANWVVTATTTDALSRGDIVKIILPNITNGLPWNPQNAVASNWNGVSLYPSLAAMGATGTNMLLNPSFESGLTSWTVASSSGGIAAFAVTSTAATGTSAVLLTASSTATGVGMIGQMLSNLSTSTTYTWSGYFRGFTGTDVVRLQFRSNETCNGANTYLYYNYDSSAWDCLSAASTTELYASASLYAAGTEQPLAYTRAQLPITPTTTNMWMNLMVGGDDAYRGHAVLMDGIQFEEGAVTSTFNLGNQAATAGVAVGSGGENNLWGRTVYGFVSSTIGSGTGFSVTLGGINNVTAQRSQTLNDASWRVTGGTPPIGGDIFGDYSVAKSDSGGATSTITRSGAALASDENSNIIPSSYAASATDVTYTFSITATSSIPLGGHIVLVFPTEFNILGATVAAQTNINASNTNQVNIAESAFTTSTDFGTKRIILTTSNATSSAGDVITVAVGGITNPASADVYRPFYIYTTKANNGLIDGSYMGFESDDYATGSPPPMDTIHIGGTNTFNIIVIKKLADNSTTTLTAGERAQVKINAGNPDKGFFAGSRWLDASGGASYNNLLDGTYVVGTEPFSKGDTTFYDSFLVPSMKSINAIGGITVTSTLTFAVPDASSTLIITGGVVGQNAFINAYSDSYQSFSPVYTDTSYVTPGFAADGRGFAKLNLKSGQNWNFDVQGGSFGNGGNFSSGGNKYWPPTIPSTYVKAGTQALGSFAYILADKTLTVTLKKAGSEEAVNNACVGVKSGGGQFFMGAQDQICQPNVGNTYQFKVPAGSVTITVSRQGAGKPDEYPVAINGASISKTIYLSSPTTYISVSVVDSSGTAINGAPVFAHGSNGFSQGMTNSVGTSTIYVSPGTYTVEGFAPGLGQLASQSATVTNSSNPTVTFTVNTGDLRTITGRVLMGTSGLAGVKIGARGTGNTTGGNGTETDNDGNFTLRVRPGTYEIGGWSPDTGGIAPVSANAVSGNVTLATWSLGGQGTLRINVKNSSNISPMFGGAFNASTGRGNGTDSWTASSTLATAKFADIKLPAGTYEVHVGSPVSGEISPAGSEATITAGATTIVTYDAATSATLITVSGTVTNSSVPVQNANIWISGIGNPMFVSTLTGSDGTYSLKVPASRNYRIGSKYMGYVSAEGDVQVNTTTTDYTQNFTISAASSAISGTITNSSGSAIANGWVNAKKVVGDNEIWTGSPTDANGNYSLDVDGATWTVYAEGPCYFRSGGLATAAGTGKNITLTANSNCTVPTPQIQGVTDSAGGQVAKGNTTLDIPANALGTANSTVSVSISNASLVVSSPNAMPMKNAVQSITASDSTGASVTSLNSNASLSIAYDPAELPIGFDEANLQLGYFDANTGQWEPVAASVDTANNKITANVSHFTDYGPILPGVPDQPTNVAATAASDSQINLTWDAIPTATEYVIYRNTSGSTTFSASDFLASSTSATYSNTGLTASTAYYYEVAGYNGNGEGPNSATVNATTNAAAAAPSGGGSSLPAAIPPVLGTTPITAVGGAIVSGNTVSLQFSVTNANEVAISENANFSGSSWQPYQMTKSFILSGGLGSKILYVKFRSSDGGISAVKTITLTVVSAGQTLAPATPAKLDQPVLSTITDVTNPNSKITILGDVAALYQPGTKLQFNYRYLNEGKKAINIRVVRQLVNSQNKVVKSVTVGRLLKSGIAYNGYVNEPLAKNLTPGNYTVKIKITDTKGKILDENGFMITMEKLKKKYFIFGADFPAAMDISFDQTIWSKVKPNVTLPATIKLKYSYTNNSGAKHTVRMVRELVDANGKVMESKTGKWNMKVGEKDSQNITQNIGIKLSAGTYYVRIRAYDWTTKELLAENSFGFAVEEK